MTVSDSDIINKENEVRAAALEAYVRVAGDFGSTMRGPVAAMLADMPRFFDPYTARDPKDLDPMLQSLQYTVDGLRNPDIGATDTVKSYLEDWQGTAAEAFEENFLIKFPQVHANHLGAAMELHSLVTAQREILARTRQSVINVGDSTIAALNQLQDEDSSSVWSVLLTVVGAVAAVAATAVNPVAGAVAWAVVSGAANVGASVVSANASGSGTEPSEVLAGMFGSLRDLDQMVVDEERILGELAQHDAELFAQNWEQLHLPRPRIADEGASNLPDFRLPAELDH